MTASALLSGGVLALMLAGNPYLEEGRRLYGEARFAQALTRLQFAVEAASDQPAELAEALLLLARCQVAERRLADAEATFLRLLRAVPGFVPDGDESPKVLEVLAAARRRVPPVAPPAPEPVASVLPKVEPEPASPAIGPLEVAPTPAPGPVGRRSGPGVVTYVSVGTATVALAVGIGLQVSSAQLAEKARAEPWVDTARNTHAIAGAQAGAALGLFIGAGVGGAFAVVSVLF